MAARLIRMPVRKGYRNWSAPDLSCRTLRFALNPVPATASGCQGLTSRCSVTPGDCSSYRQSFAALIVCAMVGRSTPRCNYNRQGYAPAPQRAGDERLARTPLPRSEAVSPTIFLPSTVSSLWPLRAVPTRCFGAPRRFCPFPQFTWMSRNPHAGKSSGGHTSRRRPHNLAGSETRILSANGSMLPLWWPLRLPSSDRWLADTDVLGHRPEGGPAFVLRAQDFFASTADLPVTRTLSILQRFTKCKERQLCHKTQATSRSKCSAGVGSKCRSSAMRQVSMFSTKSPRKRSTRKRAANGKRRIRSVGMTCPWRKCSSAGHGNTYLTRSPNRTVSDSRQPDRSSVFLSRRRMRMTGWVLPVPFPQRFMENAKKNKDVAATKAAEQSVASNATPSSPDAKTKPVATIQVEDCSASIWARQHVVQGNPRVFYSVSLERSYKDRNGARKYTRSFDPDSLGKVVCLCQQAMSRIDDLVQQDAKA